MTRYTLTDFHAIGFDGFQITLPEGVIDQINTLVGHVGSPNYIRTPVFQKGGKGEPHSMGKKKRDKHDQSNPAHWDKIKKFQATKIEEKTGVDAQINQIRCFLNKLTDKNMDDIIQQIMVILDEIIKNDDAHDHIDKVANTLFDIASTNRFFSKVYAEVYGELCSKYAVFEILLEKNYSSFLDMFTAIEHASPEVDYNAFCKTTKMNDRRRALSNFYLNLYCSGVIPLEKVEHIMVSLLNNIVEGVHIQDKAADVDEYTENVFILYSRDMEYTPDIKLSNGMTIDETILHFANAKKGDYVSLTNKCIFKYMDMCGL